MRHYLGNLLGHIDQHKWTYALLVGAMALAVAKAAETPGGSFLTISTEEGLIRIPAMLIDGVVSPLKDNLCAYFRMF